MAAQINVKMFGGISVSVNGKSRTLAQDKMTKPWQIFCYIVLRSGEIVSSRELMNVFWGESSDTEAANVLKNTVYALRKELEALSPKAPKLIIYKHGGYAVSPEVKLSLDVDDFINQCNKADSLGFKSAHKEDACRRAIAAYKGEMLPMLRNEPWTVLENRKCLRRYINCVHQLCRILEAHESWDELGGTAAQAVKCDQLDELCLVYLFRSFEARGMWYKVLTVYNRVSSLQVGIAGKKLCAEIEEIHARALKNTDGAEKDVMFIREDIIESQVNQNTAYFCSYDMLKYIYPFLQRTAERGSQRLVLMLATLVPTGEETPEAHSHALEDAYLAIAHSMRRSDAFARYDDKSFAIIFVAASDDNAEGIQKRLDRAFGDLNTKKTHTLSYECTTM